MKDLVPIGEEKNDAFSRILRFLDQADIVLTAEEDKILSRWAYCDALLRSRRHKSDEIVTKLTEKFGVSKYTAQSDIRNTYALFGQTRVLSKQYILSHHIEDIQQQIERIKYDKSLVHLLPKLYAELTRATVALPDEVAKKEIPTPTILIGSLTVNNGNGQPVMSIDEAKEKWKQRKKKAPSDDYIDFEDKQ